MSRTLEINGLAEKFNWDARYKFPLNKKQWTRVSGCCNDLPFEEKHQAKLYLFKFRPWQLKGPLCTRKVCFGKPVTSVNILGKQSIGCWRKQGIWKAWGWMYGWGSYVKKKTLEVGLMCKDVMRLKSITNESPNWTSWYRMYRRIRSLQKWLGWIGVWLQWWQPAFKEKELQESVIDWFIICGDTQTPPLWLRLFQSNSASPSKYCWHNLSTRQIESRNNDGDNGNGTFWK